MGFGKFNYINTSTLSLTCRLEISKCEMIYNYIRLHPAAEAENPRASILY